MPDKKATSDIGPAAMGPEFVKKLGGEPPKKDVEAVMKANTPSSRSPAPGSFRPGGKETSK